MTYESIVGIAASVLTGIASIPQLIKIRREKKAEDISVIMYLVLLTGLALWTYYGFLRKDLILICSNAFSFTISLMVLIFALLYKKKKKVNRSN